MTGLYFMCTIYGKVLTALCIIVCMYVCMYEVGSYTCIEGFRLNHALLNLSLCGTHSCMCVSVSVSVYLHTFRFVMFFSIFLCGLLPCVCVCNCTHVNVHVCSWSPLRRTLLSV